MTTYTDEYVESLIEHNAELERELVAERRHRMHAEQELVDLIHMVKGEAPRLWERIKDELE